MKTTVFRDVTSYSLGIHLQMFFRNVGKFLPGYTASACLSNVFDIKCLMWPGYRSRCSNSLRAARSGDRIPVGRDLPHPSRPGWGPLSPLQIGCRVSFSGVKRPRRGVNHPTPSSADVKEGVELYVYSPSGPSWPVLGWPLPIFAFINCLNSFRDMTKI